VLICSIDAHSVLRSFCFDNEVETLSSVQMVPAVLSACSVMQAEYSLDAKLGFRRTRLSPFKILDKQKMMKAIHRPRKTTLK
ncbi:hypothetical protein ACH5RR_008801, partial [Cinchona calisaya]